ncbi:hypothetical protein NE865_11832 [Phthorimaea operculella]|nr:hypothetical protein NE865_11832 [Phthorimaea operculella]
MARNFVYNFDDDRPGLLARTSASFNKFLWATFCCGKPGQPCHFCRCCHRQHRTYDLAERPCVNRYPYFTESTATQDRLAPPHRPHAPGRKSTPEMISAVKCALNQLQGEPCPVSGNVVTVQATHIDTQPG